MPTPASPSAGQTVTLPLSYGTSATASPVIRVTVDWGDGQSQSYTGQPAAVSHVYRAAGSYLIVLTGVDSFGDATTSSTSVTVTAQARPIVTISLASGSTTLSPGTVASFTVSATEPAGSTATITSVTVDFGDGSQVTLQGAPTTVQHVYQTSGTFTVTAIATDSNGNTGSGSTVIVVGGAPPTAAFTTSPATPKAGATVFFNGSDSTGNIVKYDWDFGDGTMASTTSATTSHVYLAAGTYTARLTVTDAFNRTNTKTATVSVLP